MLHLRPAEEYAITPLSERAAEMHVQSGCFSARPPGPVGVELEWLVRDGRDPARPVPYDKVARALPAVDASGRLPGNGRLTVEPGGQIELSSAPAAGIGDCVAAASGDLAAVRTALSLAGVILVGSGVDPLRPPVRIVDLPRYAAMEEFFDRDGPWGRVMMCSTASVQVCVEAGLDAAGAAGFGCRWRLLHALGPVLVSAFANSPLRAGCVTGWKSTRQAVWARLDPSRTGVPAGAAPWPAGPRGSNPEDLDPREMWARYALDAQVMCLRRNDSRSWIAPPGLTFRGWLRGAGERRPTLADLTCHLSTLFPPVRPRGHLEVRMIDAQPADSWVAPAAVVAALLDDPAAADLALAAAEPVWRPWLRGPRQRNGASCPLPAGASPWLRAARLGPADPVFARAGLACVDAAAAALARAGAPDAVRGAVAAFAEQYASRGRCPADDILEARR
jgi:glutamate--cysteine ligase